LNIYISCVILWAVEKIRALGEIDVKIVGLSIDDNAQEVFMSAEADVFVLKPIKLEVLGAMFQEVTSTRRTTPWSKCDPSF
jgi:hypothetical protein